MVIFNLLMIWNKFNLICVIDYFKIIHYCLSFMYHVNCFLILYVSFMTIKIMVIFNCVYCINSFISEIDLIFTFYCLNVNWSFCNKFYVYNIFNFTHYSCILKIDFIICRMLKVMVGNYLSQRISNMIGHH